MTKQASTPPLHVGHTISARKATLKKLASMPPSDRRAETQALLLEAGRQLFIEQGIMGTSVKDLCSLAGFSRGAFYSNFSDMEHFIERLAHEQWKTITEAVDESLKAFLNSERLPLVLDSKNATELASRFLEIMPISRAFHLLHTEIVSYLARSCTAREEMRIEYRAFKEHLGRALSSALEKTGRHCILSPIDTAELFLACAERSMCIGLAERDDDLKAYIERIAPTLLVQLTVPSH